MTEPVKTDRPGDAEAAPLNWQMYSMDETARELGIGVTTLRKMANANRIRTVYIGRRRLVRAVDLAEFLNSLPDNPVPSMPKARASWFGRRK